MKEWAITLLAVVGGYVVIRWVLHRQGHFTGLSGELSGTQTAAGMPIAQYTGVGDYFVSPIASGVPVFPDYAIANGHGDQVAAPLHSNAFSTINGGPVYIPAFGPQENQNGGLTFFA